MGSIADVIAELEAAEAKLAPPFLALPECGETADLLAYRRGARDAYRACLQALKELSPGEQQRGAGDAEQRER
jgi:hypothetical protein